MRIACPGCDAAYDVAAERLPPGRGVRCVKCGVVWTPVAMVDAEPPIVPVVERAVVEEVAPEVVPPVVVEAAPEVAPEVAVVAEVVPPALPAPAVVTAAPAVVAPVLEAEVRRAGVRGRALVLLGWVVTVAVLGGVGTLAVTRRAEVMQAWKPSERLYVLLGLAR